MGYHRDNVQQVFTFAFQFYCITIKNIQYCVLYIILCLSGLLVFASPSPNRVRYFRGRVSNFVQSEARKQSLLASGGGNLRPFPKYTVLYKYEKDIFDTYDKISLGGKWLQGHSCIAITQYELDKL